MSFLERLQLGFDSQIGVLLIGLLGLLTILAGTYAVMAWVQKKRDRLAYQFRTHYEKAYGNIPDFKMGSIHWIDFFGRESKGQFADGQYGVCCIPPPDFVDNITIERFRSFRRATDGQQNPIFTKYKWTFEEDLLITIQTGTLNGEGQLLTGGREYLQDQRLTLPEIEQLLVDLATGLAALHRLKTETGEPLYHGFILPRSLFLEFNSFKSLDKIAVADTGMAFSSGAAKLYQRLEMLRSGKLIIDKTYGQELLEQLVMLAPEQKNPHRLAEVGPACDFYAFAALAIHLLTRQKFISSQNVNWNKIPDRWQPFLKAALADRPECRPRDFLELEDWLNDPELALTRLDTQTALPPGESSETQETSLEDLARILDKVKKRPLPATEDSPKQKLLTLHIDEGSKAISHGKWNRARDFFHKGLTLNPQHPEILLGLAITYYELGDLSRSEEFYLKAKEHDPAIAKRFREHLAFRV